MNLNLIECLQPKTVNLENLLLNPNNPRIMGTKRKVELSDERISEPDVQTSVFKSILKEGIVDLYEKIQSMGFLTIDRIVVRKLQDKDSYVVLEGNRRITTAKLLLKEHSEGIISLDDSILSSIQNIEVLVYSGEDKNIIWLLQGMRHINGIKEWGALQQAKFLVQMQEEEDLNATKLDKMTGLGRNKIATKIRAYKAFEFCQDFYHNDLAEEHFSLFSEAIFTKIQLRTWLDWDDINNNFKNLENLEKLLEWYIGDEEGKKRFDKVIDVRDKFTKILMQENSKILAQFIDEEITLEDALSEIKNKNAEKSVQESQLDINKRLQTLKELYTSLSTIPAQIIKSHDSLDEFKNTLLDIKNGAEFQLNILVD